jgi:hypothetical protein
VNGEEKPEDYVGPHGETDDPLKPREAQIVARQRNQRDEPTIPRQRQNYHPFDRLKR